MRKSLLVVCLLAGGCDLYWGGGGGDDVCKGAPAIPAEELRDPSTGQCSAFGGGGGDCGCGQLCPDTGGLFPDWAPCSGMCEGLDEHSCFVTPGCHAAYLDGGDSRQFWGCWEVAQSGPIEGGGCTNLDAQTCSEHDDCTAIYAASNNTTVTKFEACAPELTPTDPCAAIDCGVGNHCEQQCYPCDMPDANGTCPGSCQPMCVPDTACTNVDCGPGYQCVESCTMNACTTLCVPTSSGPGDCYGTVTCGLMQPACPSGTTPGVANGCYTGFCIPTADCGPNDPGHCYDPVTCNAAPPVCPMGTLPGITNGCYTGYCIPTTSCELAACETLTSETSCTTRADCIPIYTGTDCTCTPNGCTCQTLTWDHCESAIMAL